jgi:hypothetical protein
MTLLQGLAVLLTTVNVLVILVFTVDGKQIMRSDLGRNAQQESGQENQKPVFHNASPQV